jgi:hypothetical protein
VLDRCPRAARAGRGQLHPAARLVDEDRALGQPVGDVQRAVAEALGEQLAHRPARGDARAQQPSRERAQAGADALQRGDRHDRRGQREQAQRQTHRRPQRPRPDEPAVVAGQSADPERGERDRQQHRCTGQRQAGERDRQLEQQHGQDAPERALPQRRAYAPPARGRGRHGRQVRLEQAVALAALALGEPPRQPRRPRQQRQPDPQRHQQDAEQQPAAEHEQVRQPLAEPDDQVQERAARGAQVRREVDRRGHDAASTVTSPLVLSACSWKAPSSTCVRPRTRLFPVSLWASIW